MCCWQGVGGENPKRSAAGVFGRRQSRERHPWLGLSNRLRLPMPATKVTADNIPMPRRQRNASTNGPIDQLGTRAFGGLA